MTTAQLLSVLRSLDAAEIAVATARRTIYEALELAYGAADAGSCKARHAA